MAAGPGGLRRAWDFFDRRGFTPHPHEAPAETPDERRRWLALMLAGWTTMLGALVAATALIPSPALIAMMAVIVTIAFPVAWRLHFSAIPRFWPNWISFTVATIGLVAVWLFWPIVSEGSRLVGSYRTLVLLFYWVMTFRAFAIRTVRDLTQTALPAASGLLLVLLAAPTTVAIVGTVLVIGGTLGLLAGEHASERLERVDRVARGTWVRGGSWRPTINSWLSLVLAAAVAGVILAAVAARVEPSNAAGRWLRRELTWRLAQLMIRDGPMAVMPEQTLSLGDPAPPPQDRLMLTYSAEIPMKMRTGTYDLYEGDRWRRSRREWIRLQRTDGMWQMLSMDELGVSKAVTEPYEVEITSEFGFMGLLPTPWCPRGVDIEVPSMRMDRSGMVAFTGHLPPGRTYTAVVEAPSAVTAPPGSPPVARTDMQNALQLPDTLPERVRELARQIAQDAEAETPTQLALAVTNYVQTEYDYDLKAPALPEGRDFVDHFLFDTRTGYCNHFASAAAVLLRELGVPTRLATGFTSGEFKPATQVYEIRDQDAHAWVEVFLPRTGWIDFDPTPDLEELTPEEGGTGVALERMRAAFDRAATWVTVHQTQVILLGLLLIIAVVAISVGGRWYERRIRPLRTGVSADERIIHAYQQALRWLTRKELVRTPTTAPWEFVAIATRSRPELAQELAVLTEKYVGARFARGPAPESWADQSETALRRLREKIFAPEDQEDASD